MRFLHAAVLFFVTCVVASAQSSTDSGNAANSAKPPKAPTSLPRPKAEPQDQGAYAPPLLPEKEGPSEMDIGPVLRHFVRASSLDTEPINDDLYNNKALQAPEKTALDKRISVPLIHDVQNDGPVTSTSNLAMQNEISYLNWGAVTEEQYDARRGHYFTITWKNGGPPADFIARFQYREVKSQEVVRSLSQLMTHVHGSVRSYFAVTGDAYLAYGPVVSWRFTILKGDTVVAQTRSFIW